MAKTESGFMGDHVAGLPGDWLKTSCHIHCSEWAALILSTTQTMVMADGYFILWAASVQTFLIEELCVETS